MTSTDNLIMDETTGEFVSREDAASDSFSSVVTSSSMRPSFGETDFEWPGSLTQEYEEKMKAKKGRKSPVGKGHLLESQPKSKVKKTKKAFQVEETVTKPEPEIVAEESEHAKLFPMYLVNAELEKGAKKDISLWHRDGQVLLQKYDRLQSKGKSMKFIATNGYTRWPDNSRAILKEVKVKSISENPENPLEKVQIVDKI